MGYAEEVAGAEASLHSALSAGGESLGAVPQAAGSQQRFVSTGWLCSQLAFREVTQQQGSEQPGVRGAVTGWGEGLLAVSQPWLVVWARDAALSGPALVLAWDKQGLLQGMTCPELIQTGFVCVPAWCLEGLCRPRKLRERGGEAQGQLSVLPRSGLAATW